MNETNRKTLAVRPETHAGLVEVGKKNESFDKIISKLLTEHGEVNKRNNVAESGSGIGTPSTRLATTVDINQGVVYDNVR